MSASTTRVERYSPRVSKATREADLPLLVAKTLQAREKLADLLDQLRRERPAFEAYELMVARGQEEVDAFDVVYRALLTRRSRRAEVITAK
jgi:hypothetical protein